MKKEEIEFNKMWKECHQVHSFGNHVMTRPTEAGKIRHAEGEGMSSWQVGFTATCGLRHMGPSATSAKPSVKQFWLGKGVIWLVLKVYVWMIYSIWVGEGILDSEDVPAIYFILF